MRVFVAGGTGALGRPLLRALHGRGHEVFALTRHPEKHSLIEALGARVVFGDALDASGLVRAVGAVEPSHIVHLLTALPPGGPLRSKDLRSTDRLRVEGTANLLRAAVEAGAKRIVAESFMGVYGTAGSAELRNEDSPLAPVPRRSALGPSINALRTLEKTLLDAREAGSIEAVVLRYGLVYGPEVPSTVAMTRRLRKRQVFVPGGANGVASFVHADDAAQATVAVLEADQPSAVYNVVDDEPLPLMAYLSLSSQLARAPLPRKAPAWLIRLAAPILAEAFFTQLPLSNSRAKNELGWTLAYPTLREGLPQTARVLEPGDPPPSVGE